MRNKLSIPSFFEQDKASQVWHVPYQERFTQALEWAKKHNIPMAAKDKTRIALMPIDCQITFCLPGGELFVGGRSGDGAVQDSIRLCEFIYKNLDVITGIFPTLDTHIAQQIFHTVFWVDENGNNPAPATMITSAEVKSGKWKVNPGIAKSLAGGNYMALQRHALHYTEKLEKDGKYALMVWPYHAMLGGIGHALVPSIEEAVFFHHIARSSETKYEIKGGNPLTENYSVLRPEVLEGHDGAPIAQKNSRFLSKLLNFDAVVIAGQAKSHCVAWTIADLLDEILAQDESLVKKVYLLEDCTSPVVIPGILDFTDQANEAFERFSDAGMHVVKSTDPIDTWPDLSL